MLCAQVKPGKEAAGKALTTRLEALSLYRAVRVGGRLRGRARDMR